MTETEKRIEEARAQAKAKFNAALKTVLKWGWAFIAAVMALIAAVTMLVHGLVNYIVWVWQLL